MNKYLCRLCFNHACSWQHPSGSEKGETNSFAADNGFGHEEWLNQPSWILPDGYRYSFLEPFRKDSAPLSVGEAILYTFEPQKLGPKQGRVVGVLRDVSKLSDLEAFKAFSYFKKKGWFQKMQKHLEIRGIDPALLDTPPISIMNVRFEPKKLVWFEKVSTKYDRYDLSKYNRYQLYKAN